MTTTFQETELFFTRNWIFFDRIANTGFHSNQRRFKLLSSQFILAKLVKISKLFIPMTLNYDSKNLEVNGTLLKRNVVSTRIKVIHSKRNFV